MHLVILASRVRGEKGSFVLLSFSSNGFPLCGNQVVNLVNKSYTFSKTAVTTKI